MLRDVVQLDATLKCPLSSELSGRPAVISITNSLLSTNLSLIRTV